MSSDEGGISGAGYTLFIILVILIIILMVYMCNIKRSEETNQSNKDSRFVPLTMVKFLDDMEREKPIRFTSKQLRIATDNFSILLGSGGFGKVYKGIITNGTTIAVKVLNGTSDERIEEQFIAEVSTMGRTHHFNLVKLYGFCFESSLRALVYEFMINGSLDDHLFKANKRVIIGFEKLNKIALGTARGIAYLHEECPQRIVHYDIKPDNILLDSNFCAKVADFGLAKLCNRDKTHTTMTGGRGTPGYAAPELWMPLPVTHKCDVYSFGMLLFEIIGRRRNMDVTLGDSQQWFPVWVWEKYEQNQTKDLMTVFSIEEKDEQVVERMLKVALCCIQYRAETRPVMSIVVKMLEGALEVPEPLNPFSHLFPGVNQPCDSLARMAWMNIGFSDCSSSQVVTGMPLMRAYEMTLASDLICITNCFGFAVLILIIVLMVYAYNLNRSKKTNQFNKDGRFIPLTMVKFLDDMEREKPIRFTSQELRIATNNFSILLGSGGFGKVYKGIFRNGTVVAVKVLNGTSDKRIEEQFMAEVSTMGRTHHFNLVRLFGFCFESSLRALVYEFMINGSLDYHLFKSKKGVIIGFEKLNEIALGTARGIAYLHEECPQRIVHYDIKPGNILLDSNFCAKVADFGLAKLCNRDKTHITMTGGGRGTPGYAAPELWMPLPVTHKCDVYSFGMLLFEIIGRRRNMDMALGDSQQWFPVWVWDKYEKNQTKDLMTVFSIEKKNEKDVERMLKVALCCVQYRPETRPVMSIVVKMLEGALEVPEPLNPFSYLFPGVNEPCDSLARMAWMNIGVSDHPSSPVVNNSTIVTGTPLMRGYEMTTASE
ncbi:hypothetical protein OSB04_021138 [Centaurea solstitialis]|uniref:Protein kinase domain-containing protein n=1 Tax=Centaurea solstitialis TaxID=347529 RepID=A0AA38STM7_9ASTR|nr:hypothetical protein OSB04_021138 [Centaurea solstitialis]